jgi:hypothetical protein
MWPDFTSRNPPFQGKNSRRAALFFTIHAAFTLFSPPASAANSARFLTFDEASEIVTAFATSGAPTGDLPSAVSWPQWIKACDRDIRNRVDRGFEDSISNLILYGTTFTALPRIASGEEPLAVRARVRDFITALARKPTNERLRFAANFLASHGVSGPAMQALLEANLSRFLAEQRVYQDTLASAAKGDDPGQLLFARSTLYQERGLSVDTSLLPNFAIEDTLRALLRRGALAPGAIRRVAIIGPGLDFADKRGGYDYYPLQTIQPFAVLEAVARLGLGQADHVQLSAFDLNSAVLAHIHEAARRAEAGEAYTIQLPRDRQAALNPDALAYWQHFGDVIGVTLPPIAAPPSLKPDILSRAVAVQPRYAARLDAFDLDIVAQTLDVEPGAGFDLVVATNILVYYDLFHQALAKAAIAHLMNPGGVLLVNHALPSQPASLLEYLGRRSVSYSPTGAYGDDMVVYRRRKPDS